MTSYSVGAYTSKGGTVGREFDNLLDAREYASELAATRGIASVELYSWVGEECELLEQWQSD